ncbi:mitochondrial branched-chain alpha-ketoacid dehydrogenase kinase-domain-containing protein [Gautieria morchelliformis]|nr:mitochondrial branched-chain alpha-ketoacid dehydrogenase kinase-domain-containing protein [Gautieria morchelliformis]
MSAAFRITSALWDKIHHFASFPQTGVSLQQMALFGQNPSQGTLLKGSQFLAEELPVRLAHRVKELDELPHNLSGMPSIKKVKHWYAQSFEELITFPKPTLNEQIRQALNTPHPNGFQLPEATPNPAMRKFIVPGSPAAGNGIQNRTKLRIPMERRYYAHTGEVDWPPEVRDYNSRFTKCLDVIKRRHDPTVTTVAQGVLEWKRSQNEKEIGLDVQAWLDRFYMSRIGIRFLIGQHIALNTLEAHKDYVGIICTNTNVRDVVHEAIENARFVCEEHYAMFKGPPVQLICPDSLYFAYVPGHLRFRATDAEGARSHICFELLKNSLRAVVERFGTSDEARLPPIKVVVIEGNEDITIKISDEGGGIPRSAIPLIWTYMYTTMEGQSVDQDFETQGSDFKAPMAGFGYGLPLSRLPPPLIVSQYARYFGGDLRLISMEGYGTDVYIHLNRLSSSREPLQ